MAGAVMNKILDFFVGDKETNEEEIDNNIDYGYEDIESDYDDYDNEVVEETTKKKLFGGKNKVVNMMQGQQIKMRISKPTSFEQSEQICTWLKEKKSIIVNLEYVNKDVARRIIDFLAGAVQALDGHMEKVSNSIFLVAPYNYQISNESTKDELKSKLSVSWLKNG